MENHETAVLFEEILKIACSPDMFMPNSSRMRIDEYDALDMPLSDGVFHRVDLGPIGSLRITATIALIEDGVRLHDIIRSNDLTVPYSDPELFEKVRLLVKWSNPWRNR